VVLIGALAFTLAGCSGRHAATAPPAPSPHGWPTHAELLWLRVFGRAARKLEGTEYASVSDRSDVPRCSALDSTPGPPPTTRLRAAFSSLTAACRAGDRRDPVAALTIVDRARSRALVGERRRLPSIEGVSDSNAHGDDESHTDPLLNRAARAVAGKPVTARCWSPYDWPHLLAETNAIDDRHAPKSVDILGFANLGGDAVDLSTEVCYYLQLIELGGYAAVNGRATPFAASALATLAHEAEHAHGVADEADTECYALQMIPTVARVLGLTRREGRIFADAAWRAYPQEPRHYRTSACRNGGPLDLHPRSTVWP
jgi:hypothetical protein